MIGFKEFLVETDRLDEGLIRSGAALGVIAPESKGLHK